MFETKEQDKLPETNLNEMEISDLLDRKFKTRTTEAKRTVHKPNEISTKNIFKGTKQITELKNTIIELKYSIEGLHIRPHQAEERITKLKNKAVAFIQTREKNKNEKE